jgi:tellurite resistance protein TerC
MAGPWPTATPKAHTKSLEFLTGYLIEKALAVDNIFVFLMIFTYFAVPPAFQKRVLMIGIIGAHRAAHDHDPGGRLADAAVPLDPVPVRRLPAAHRHQDVVGRRPGARPGDNPALKLLRRLMPVSKRFDGEKFFTVENGRRIATPLLLVICLVGVTDVIFAVDSIPAIFAITTDPFIVLTSNVFAILGLRAMYFLLAAVAASSTC